MQYTIASFRGDEQQTLVEISFAISLSDLAKEIGQEALPDSLEKGFVLQNLQWQNVARQLTTVALRRSVPEADLFIDQFRFTAPPDSYIVAFHARPRNARLLQGWKFPYRVPDYAQSRLLMSDIQLAFKVTPAAHPGRFTKNGFLVLPNPTRRFSRDKPIFVYFELYHLALTGRGTTSFAIEYTLKQTKPARTGLKKLLGFLFRRQKASLSFTTEGRGNSEFSQQYLALDAKEVEAGEYVLRVEVTDKVSRETIAGEAILQID